MGSCVENGPSAQLLPGATQVDHSHHAAPPARLRHRTCTICYCFVCSPEIGWCTISFQVIFLVLMWNRSLPFAFYRSEIGPMPFRLPYAPEIAHRHFWWFWPADAFLLWNCSHSFESSTFYQSEIGPMRFGFRIFVRNCSWYFRLSSLPSSEIAHCHAFAHLFNSLPIWKWINAFRISDLPCSETTHRHLDFQVTLLLPIWNWANAFQISDLPCDRLKLLMAFQIIFLTLIWNRSLPRSLDVTAVARDVCYHSRAVRVLYP